MASRKRFLRLTAEDMARCQGKHRFDSRARAIGEADRLRRSKGASIEAYRCVICSGYHVGENSIRTRKERESKFENKVAIVDGHRFASRKEARRYRELQTLEQAKVISDLKLQPRYPVKIGGVEIRFASGRQLTYVADFEYIDRETGEVVVEDTKGFETEGFRIKFALMAAMGVKVSKL